MPDRNETPVRNTFARHVRFPHITYPHIHFTQRELHDRPLAGEPHPDHPLHWKLYGCECVATAVLMILGIFTNTLLASPGSPLYPLLEHHPALMTALCGLSFGGAGTLAAMTPFGRVSGAHLSPSVSLAFALGGRLAPLDLAGYVCAQILGACVGTGLVFFFGLLLPHWSALVGSVNYTSTQPTPLLSPIWVLLTELGLTAGLVFVLYWFAAHPRMHVITPWASALYFFLANPIVAWISGDSTNFARSLAPALFSRSTASLWIYLIGPLLGSALAVMILRSGLLGRIHLLEARIINFGHHGRIPRLQAPEAASPKPAPSAPVSATATPGSASPKA